MLTWDILQTNNSLFFHVYNKKFENEQKETNEEAAA